MTNIDELINEGNQFNFENNKKFFYDQFYSEATPEFLSWVSKVEDYIVSNYNESSGPYNMLSSVKKSKFSGYYQSEFETEFNKLKGAINSCKSLKPNKKSQRSDNLIISLITNPIFWTVLVVVAGTAYKLGNDNGVTKFDSEKILLEKENTLYKDSMNSLKKEAKSKQLEILKTKN